MERTQQEPRKALCWEDVRERVYPVLFPQEVKPERLQEILWHPWLDLAVCYQIRLAQESAWEVGVYITEGLLRTWGISEGELERQALQNIGQDGYQIRSLSSVISSFQPDLAVEDTGMSVVTNREMRYGAAGMLDLALFKRMTGDQSCYIIPSSIHELILLWDVQGLKPELLNQMVQEVNEEHVTPEEWLSNHAYYYDHQTEQIAAC